MWGPGWWGGPMWGFGWISPAICLVFVIGMMRAMSGGGGFMCMGGHHHDTDDAAGLRRQVEELRDEVNRLKAAG